MAKRRKWLLAVAFATLTVVAAVLLWWILFPGKAFDPVAWQDQSQVRDGVRLGMADRLIAHRMLLGKTRDEVVNLLGEPTQTGHFGNWDLVYWLGPERSFISIDSEWLVLRLDDDGRVVENRLVRD